MENLSAIWIMVGMAATVLIAGVAWGDIRRQVNNLTKQWDRDRKETREWLKDLQAASSDHEGHIKVLLDRIER